MIIKLIKLHTNLENWQPSNNRIKHLIKGGIYEVIFIDSVGILSTDINNVVVSDEYIEDQNNILRYKVLDDDGDLVFIPRDCFEILDRTIPKFWLEQDYYGGKVLAPEGWNGDFFSSFDDGNTEIRIKFYKQYQKLYNKPIKIEKNSRLITDGLDVTIHNKSAYLKPNDKELEFIFVTQEDELYDENEFGLSFNKTYKVFEVKNYDNYWYKLNNNNGKDYFYPRYIFNVSRNENWYKFFCPELSDKRIKEIIAKNDNKINTLNLINENEKNRIM